MARLSSRLPIIEENKMAFNSSYKLNYFSSFNFMVLSLISDHECLSFALSLFRLAAKVKTFTLHLEVSVLMLLSQLYKENFLDQKFWCVQNCFCLKGITLFLFLSKMILKFLGYLKGTDSIIQNTKVYFWVVICLFVCLLVHPLPPQIMLTLPTKKGNNWCWKLKFFSKFCSSASSSFPMLSFSRRIALPKWLKEVWSA